MSKILFFSDIHFANNHRFSTLTDDGYTIREKEHLSCADTLINILNNEKIDKVVCGGDWWGPVGDMMSAETLSAITEFFVKMAAACKEKGIVFETLVGNHEQCRNNIHSQIHKLVPFKYFDNVKVYDIPTQDDKYVYMPYCTDDVQATTFLEAVQNKQDKIIFSHLDFAGIDLGNNIFSKKGVSLDLLHKFKKVLQGHYHKASEYGSKIIVVGSTQRLSFKDRGSSRNNIVIYDTDTNTYERRSFDCPDWLTFTDENITDVLKIDDNNYVRIDISTDIFLTEDIKNKLQNVKGKDIHIDINRISVNKQITEEIDTKDESEILAEFVNNSDNSQEQKEALIKEGIRLLKSVK